MQFPIPIIQKNTQRTAASKEKLTVILSLTIVNTLILGMTALFYIEKTKGFPPRTNSITTVPSEIGIERRKEVVRNFNNDLIRY